MKTCYVPVRWASCCSGNAADFILNILGPDVGRAIVCSHNCGSDCCDLISPTEWRTVPYDTRRMAPSESLPYQFSHRILVSLPLFYAFLLYASCQFTPLLNLRSPIVGLTLLNVCTFQSPIISWPTVGVAAWRTSRRVLKYGVAIDRREIAQLLRYS